jgi:hypothetical protein
MSMTTGRTVGVLNGFFRRHYYPIRSAVRGLVMLVEALLMVGVLYSMLWIMWIAFG